jgi:hypothetical protein
MIVMGAEISFYRLGRPARKRMADPGATSRDLGGTRTAPKKTPGALGDQGKVSAW